jgi:hypothetical protein
MAEWAPFGNNLPNTRITDLEIQISTNELFASTYGRGIWKTNVLPNKVEEYSVTKSEISIYPNPAHGDFNLNIILAEPFANNDLELRISDIIGRPVYQESITVGSNPIPITVKPKLQSGIYFVQVKINGRNYSARLVVSL